MAISLYFFGITILIVCMIYTMIMALRAKWKGDEIAMTEWFIWWLIYTVLASVALKDIEWMIKKLE